MPIRHTAALPGVALVLAASALSGCSADAEPEAKPSETVSVSPTPNPSESVTPAPVGETAEEFIRRWNLVQNEMQKGDTTEWRLLSPHCGSCIRSADQVDDIYASGGYIKTDGRKVLSIKRSKHSENPDVFTFTFRSAHTVLQRSRSATEESLPGGKASLEVHLERDGGVWLVKDVWQMAQ